jgi:AraC-like DNA-binding protein
VLFAGPCRITDKSVLEYEAPPGLREVPEHVPLPRLTPEQVGLYRECLSQLGARLRCLVLDRQAKGEDSSSMSRRQRVERYLSNHLTEPLLVADLARELHLSVDRCRRVVREECGLGFAELLRQMRLRLACSLLLNTDLTIERVAGRCGLSDPSGFSRAFQQAFGLSPGRWRRQNRG